MTQQQAIQASGRTTSMEQSAMRVGYSVLWAGPPGDLEVCLVMPTIEAPLGAHFLRDQRELVIEGACVALALPSLPADVARLISVDLTRVLLVGVDTLSSVRFSSRFDRLVSGLAGGEQQTPASLFNDFMTRAVRGGDLRVEHRRVRTRQPENEAFVRKALAAVERLTSGTEISASIAELTLGQATPGRSNLASAAAAYLASHPVLAQYLGEPADSVGGSNSVILPLELFSLLHAYAFHEIGQGLKAIPDFGASASVVAAALSGQSGVIRPRVLGAADSVFAQSFADVHAISMAAAVDGLESAKTMLAEVRRRRAASGDFAAFSLAPLSHDTSMALDILSGELNRNQDFKCISRDQLWGQSLWMAAEGLGAWMVRHGASSKTAAAVVQALEIAGQIVASASGGVERKPTA
ncbi:hypothetical protein [Paucibacter soli]|uniref:hypothetical protein n=1 Tax=Paucibacter soli TaxID=3133433 RepID=UPI0030A6E5AD